MPVTYQYKCKFCSTPFTSETRYLKHYCKQMKRDDESRTVVGQAAWLFYQKWMKAHRRLPPKASSFLKSKFYESFMRFAKFARKVNIPDIDSFIWLMKEKDLSPTLWTANEAYAEYLEFIDRRGDPKTLATITVETLFKIADAAQCEVNEVFDILQPSEIIQFLRERRFSPWLLLHSTKFMYFYAHNTSAEERIIIESIIRPKYWKEKFNKHPEIVGIMKTYVEELNI